MPFSCNISSNTLPGRYISDIRYTFFPSETVSRNTSTIVCLGRSISRSTTISSSISRISLSGGMSIRSSSQWYISKILGGPSLDSSSSALIRISANPGAIPFLVPTIRKICSGCSTHLVSSVSKISKLTVSHWLILSISSFRLRLKYS